MKELTLLMEKAVADGVFPGAVLLADLAGRPLFLEAFGLARLAPALPMTRDTIFTSGFFNLPNIIMAIRLSTPVLTKAVANIRLPKINQVASDQ